MRPVSMTPFTTSMVAAGAVYGFCATVRLAVFFAGLDGFIKAHFAPAFQSYLCTVLLKILLDCFGVPQFPTSLLLSFSY